jgi:hypothetical protein
MAPTRCADAVTRAGVRITMSCLTNFAMTYRI